MRVLFHGVALAVSLLTPAFGAIDGVVVNSTTGQPVPSITVSLIHPGENGMQTLASVKSGADGSFKIDQELPGPPALLQGDYQGVTYTQVLPPNRPTSGVQFEVYEATAKLPSDLVPLHLLMLDSVGASIEATETFVMTNKGKTTFQSPNGSAQFYPPKGVSDALKVTVIPPTQMPIQRSAEKTKEAGMFKIDYPIKPGETEFDIHYTLPVSGGLSGKVVPSDPPMKLLVPLSVKVTGDGIQDQGQPPNMNARLYSFTGSSFDLKVEGTGSVKLPETTDQQQEDTGAPESKEIDARIYDRLGWVLGLTFGILALGGTLLFRKGTA